MAVEMLEYPGGTDAFIFCDKDDDIARVEVPLGQLRRWQVSAEAVATLVRQLLGAIPLSGVPIDKRWPVGRLAGNMSAERIVLSSEKPLQLEVGGHSVELAEILRLKGKKLTIEKQRVLDCVNSPAARRGESETPAQRHARIAKIADERGVAAAAAAEGGLSHSRIKKITRAHRLRVAGK